MSRPYTPNSNPEKTRKINIDVSSQVDQMIFELMMFHDIDKHELFARLVAASHGKMSRDKKVILQKRKAQLLKDLEVINKTLSDMEK